MRVRLETPGGGGYGPVNERDPAAVQADLDAEYISADAARNAYGVEPNT
jgi:N-methylhydantoinase B